MNLSSIPGRVYILVRGAINRFLCLLLRPLFLKCGKNVRFDAFGYYSYSTISIGDDVFVGKGAKFVASVSSITIDNKVMFGPNVTIRGGTHNITQKGQFMADVHKKRLEDDLPVVIESDVWVGACVTILKGVHIGRGAVIGAGTVVVKNVAPYSINVGVPSRKIRSRWTFEEILEHEKILYSEPERFSPEAIKEFLYS